MQTESRQNLIDAARAVSARAYAPYSGFRVGAAALAGGRVHVGCNVENASYGLTACAERNAVAAAVAAGDPAIEAIVIYTDTDDPTPPCGACRQVLAEFGPSMEVLMTCRTGKVERTTLADLLPRSFTFDRGQGLGARG